jgi:hypothetical protein
LHVVSHATVQLANTTNFGCVRFFVPAYGTRTCSKVRLSLPFNPQPVTGFVGCSGAATMNPSHLSDVDKQNDSGSEGRVIMSLFSRI